MTASANKVAVVYTTLPSAELAEQLAHDLLANRLCACVNIFPKMRSLYRWKDKIEKSDEWAVIIKTSIESENSVIAWIKKNHPYELPALVHGQISADLNFLDYITDCVSP